MVFLSSNQFTQKQDKILETQGGSEQNTKKKKTNTKTDSFRCESITIAYLFSVILFNFAIIRANLWQLNCFNISANRFKTRVPTERGIEWELIYATAGTDGNSMKSTIKFSLPIDWQIKCEFMDHFIAETNCIFVLAYHECFAPDVIVMAIGNLIHRPLVHLMIHT